MISPHRGYLLCGEPRSGTTFLKRLIDSTGELGHPEEHLSSPRISRAVEVAESAVADMLAHASTANGIYGIKVFGYHMDLVWRGRLIDRLPEPSFVYVERRDLLGQAISEVRAQQEGLYKPGTRVRPEPRYSRRAIDRQVHRIAFNRARWREYFAINAIEPLVLTFEDFTVAPGTAVEAIAELMGVPHPVRYDLSRLPKRRADAPSAEWRERFVEQAGDRNRLPDRFFPGRILLRRRLRDVLAVFDRA